VCLKAGLNSVEERQISANGKVNIVSAWKYYAYKLYILHAQLSEIYT
jgi:hypothetical protein